MTASLVTQSPDPRPARSGAVIATMWLLLATAFWGAGFSWAKLAQETVNRDGPGANSAVGPIAVLAVRFTLAGIIWTLLFPKATRGWTGASVGRVAILGSLLGAGMILQHLGLDRSSEAVTAFLTALSILFVPLISTIFLRRPPAAVLWVGVAIALVGVWRMTGGSPRGFGLGEALGVSCALVFSFHLIAINALVVRDSPWRMTGGQFLVIGFICFCTLPFLTGGTAALHPAELVRLFWQKDVLGPLLLLIALPTLASFAFMVFYQPRVDPTRAALIYLVEPIWAGLFAWWLSGKPMPAAELQGAALLLAANALVEIVSARRAGKRIPASA